MEAIFEPTEFPLGGFQSKKELADYVIYGVPLDRTASFRSGCGKGPNHLRFANANIETVSSFSRIDLSSVLIHDLGNLVIKEKSTQQVLEELGELTAKCIAEKRFPLAIGGEHTIIAGIAQSLPKSTLVVVDAHLDLRDKYNDDKFSHACAIARAYEEGDFDNIVFIGTRAVSSEELDFAVEERFTILWAHDLISMSALEFRKTISKIFDSSSAFYLSLDLDGIDPAFAPGVGNPETNGLWPWHVLELVYKISPKLVGADITEYNPELDDSSLRTGILAARIAQTILVEHYNSRNK